MAGLASIFGFGNASGGQWQATGAPIAQATTAQQAQSSLGSQQALVDALRGQDGVGGQKQALDSQQALAGQLGQLGGAQNVGSAYDQQQALANQLAGQGGVGNQASVFNQQQALSNQLGNIAAGQGPNPAQAQLAQATGQNVSNQAALMAGQRGAGSNVGLLARQAAQQGAATQQQAVGQGASLQAQQSLNALSAQGAQQQAMAGLASNQVAQQQAAQGQLANQASNQVALQQGAQGAAANQANTLSAQQQAAQQQVTSNQLNQLGSQNQLAVQQQSNMNNTNAQIQGINAKSQNDLAAGLLGGLGSAAMALAEGGEVPQMGSSAILKENYGPKSNIGQHLHRYAKGGKVHKNVPALVSPGEIILSPEKAKQVKAGHGNPLDGKRVPGKAAVGGAVNSYANDTVPMNLKEKSVVLPRAVTQSPNPKAAAERFIAALKAKKGGK